MRALEEAASAVEVDERVLDEDEGHESVLACLGVDRAFQSNSDPFVFSVHDITKLDGSSTRLAKKE